MIQPEAFHAYVTRFSDVFHDDLILAVDKYLIYRREYSKVKERLQRLVRIDAGVLDKALGDIDALATLATQRLADFEQYKAALSKANSELLTTLRPQSHRIILE